MSIYIQSLEDTGNLFLFCLYSGSSVAQTGLKFAV